MKKQFILSLFLLSAIAVGAKTIHKVVNPTYIGMQQGTMEITSVKTTEEATTITFQYPGEGFYQFVPDIHLVDEQGKHYELIGQKGFSEDSLKNLKPKKKGKYELHFEPLPAETRIFDFIEDTYYIGGTRYYGIREKDAPFVVSNPLPHNEGDSILSYADFKVDTVLVTGHIKNYQSAKSKFKAVMKYTFSPLEEHETRLPKTTIDENGNFSMNIRAIGPTWTYLMLYQNEDAGNEMFIPIILYPGDHIDLQITLDEENIKKDVVYSSKLQRDFSKLMKYAPMSNVDMFITPYRNDKNYSKEYEEYERMSPESVQKQFDDYDALALYLSGKYGLERLETEILRSHLSIEMAIKVVGLTNNYMFKVLRVPNQTEEEYRLIRSKWRDCDSPYYGISISNIRAENNTFMVTPYWTNLFSNQNLRDNPRHEKLLNDLRIYTMTFVHGDIELTEAGEVPSPFSYKGTPEIDKKQEIVRNNEFEWYYERLIQLVREWRQKDKDDTLFEQAFLLSLAKDLHIGVTSVELDNEWIGFTLTRYYKQHNRARQLYHHPNVVRMASTLLEENIQDILQRQDERIEELKKAQQNNK